MQTVDYILRTTWLSLKKMYNDEGAKFGITMATGFALLSIDTKIGISATALGPKMGIESTSLSRTIKLMEQKGLVTKHPNPSDGRGVIIKLTARGLEARSRAREKVLQFNNAVMHNISKKKLSHFFEVSKLIGDIASNKAIFKKSSNLDFKK